MKSNSCIILIALCGCISFTAMSQPISSSSNDYAILWQKVMQYEEDGLPESALSEIQKIDEKALIEKNKIQRAKSKIFWAKNRIKKDIDQLNEVFQELETFATQLSSIPEKAIFNLMIAELYDRYYQQHSWKIRNRTNLREEIPEKIEEWTSNHFADKVFQYLKASIQEKEALQAVQRSLYDEMFGRAENEEREKNETLYNYLQESLRQEAHSASQLYRNAYKQTDLIDNTRLGISREEFLKLSIIPQSMCDFNCLVLNSLKDDLIAAQKKGNREETLLTDLNRLQTIPNDYNLNKKKYAYLNGLIEEFKDIPVVVEAYFMKYNSYLNEFEKDEKCLLEFYNSCQELIRLYSDYKNISKLKNVVMMMEKPICNVSFPAVLSPKEKCQISLTYKNMDRESTLEIYRIPQTAIQCEETKMENRLQFNKENLLQTIPLCFPNSKIIKKDTVLFVQLPLGVYKMVVKSKDAISTDYSDIISVTHLMAINRMVTDSTMEVLVVNRETGQPMKGIEINFYKREYRNNGLTFMKTQTAQTDKEGFACANKTDNSFCFTLSDKIEKELFIYYGWNQYFVPYTEDEVEKVSLLTDRSIYRPGQTVYFKGIAYKLGKNPGISTRKSFVVSLRDVNGTEVQKQEYKTNEYGSFSGSFVLPIGLLNGSFSFFINGVYTQSIQVEEYKRPTFEIVFDTIRQSYQLGDLIKITGKVKSYSGVPVQSIKGHYQVSMQPYWRYQATTEETWRDSLTINDDGIFSFTFTAKDDKPANSSQRFFSYEVSVTIMDENGETHTQRKNMLVGNCSVMLFINKDDLNAITEEKDTFMVNAQNLEMMNVEKECQWKLYSLNDYISFEAQEKGDSLTVRKLEAEGCCLSNQKFVLPIKNLKSGRYRLYVETKDDQERLIYTEENFVRCNINDKKPPILTYFWFQSEHTLCLPGEEATFQVGSSAKDVYLFFEIYGKTGKLEQKKYRINNECIRISLPYKKEYGEGVTASFYFVKKGKIFQRQTLVTLRKESQKLEIQFSTFRDKLLPGSLENWTLHVTKNGKPYSNVELLATMYDASLDKLYGHNWDFYPRKSYHIAIPQWNGIYRESRFLNLQFKVNYENWNIRNYIQSWWGLANAFSSLRYEAEESIPFNSKAMGRASDVMFDKRNLATSSVHVQLKEISKNSFSTEDNFDKSLEVRHNLNETAFFYPHLITNMQGDVQVQFTVPESLTRWNVKGLAHSKELCFGEIKETVVTQKKMVVTPNFPRFFRRGDQIGISAKVSNLSEKQQTVKVIIELLNPATEELLKGSLQEQQVVIDAGETMTVTWQVMAPDSSDFVVVRIKAVGDSYSDGEQQVLPILNSQMLITESLPMNVRSGRQYQFAMKSLQGKQVSATIIPHRMVLEFATNPSWYAIQALPSISSSVYDNTLNWFTTYYASIIAQSVIHLTPTIERIFTQWKEKDDFVSKLEKNQDLKNILLNESPWVMNGKNESERMQRIGLLFDLNNQKQLLQQAIRKIENYQSEDGGWPWLPGMPDSRYITQFIIENMSKISALNTYEFDETEKMIQLKALQYMDSQIEWDYKTLQNDKKLNMDTYSPNIMQIYYLYARSGYRDIPIGEKAKPAFDYFLIQMEKYASKSVLFAKALSAITLHRYGKEEKAKQLLQSLRELANQSEEMGMYWPKNKNGYSWNENSITIHTSILQAFAEIDPVTKELDGMKIWLLKQKQTEDWGNSLATIEAIAALTMQGSNWLCVKDNNIQIQWGKETLLPVDKEVGTGYFRKEISSKEITQEKAHVSVYKGNEGLAWGALYYQYFEGLNQVKGSKNDLQIEKQLLKESVIGNRTELKPISEDGLKIGDKVVTRMVVTTNRDMEYVHLKDSRPACLEPLEQISQTVWKEGLCFYQSNKDASMNYFFHFLPKGIYVFEYSSWVTRNGIYTEGPATIECMYAPEFRSHSRGNKLEIK